MGDIHQQFDMLEQLKGARRFGTRFAILVTGLVWFLSGAQITLSLFVTQEPPRFPICSSTDCNPNKPLVPADCTTPYHFLRPQISIVSTYNLPTTACEPRMWRNSAAIHSCLFLGILAGALGIAPISDKKGRRPLITFGVLGILVSASYSTIAPSIYTYAAARFFVGCASSACALPSMALLSEITPTRRRQWIVAVQAISFCVAASYVSVIACFVPSWRILTFATILPALLFVIGVPCCGGVYLESPKWLAARGRMEEAFGTWLRIAHVCGVELDDKLDFDAFVKNELQAAHDRNLKSESDVEEELSLMSVKQMVTPDTVLKAFRTFPASVWMWVCIWLWMVTAFVYYGVLLDFGDLIASLRDSSTTDNTLLRLFNAPIQDPNLRVLPHGANKRRLVDADLLGADPEKIRDPSDFRGPQIATSSVLGLAIPDPGTGPDSEIEAGPQDPKPSGAFESGHSIDSHRSPTEINDGEPLVIERGYKNLGDPNGIEKPVILSHHLVQHLDKESDESSSLLSRSFSDSAMRHTLAGGVPPSDIEQEHHKPLKLDPEEHHVNPEIPDAPTAAVSADLISDSIQQEKVAAEPSPMMHAMVTSDSLSTAMAARMNFLQKYKAAEYLDNVGAFVRNRSKDILEQAKHLPKEAGRLYDDFEMQQMLNSLYSDMSAQFTPDDPMAPYWADVRLKGLLVLISFLLEIPAYAIAMCMAAHPLFGRKRTVTSLLFTGGTFIVGAFAVQLVGVPGTLVSGLTLALTVVGRCCIAGVFMMLYLYCAEIFPTSIRTSTLGLLSAVARIGCVIAAPFAAMLDSTLSGLALLVFGGLSLSAGMISISALPETYGQPLYDTIDTLEDMYTKNGYCEDFFTSWPNRLCAMISRATCCLGRLGANCLNIPGERTPSTFEEKGHSWLKKQWRKAGRTSHKSRSPSKQHTIRDSTMFVPVGDHENNPRLLQTRAFDMEEETEFVDTRTTLAV